MPRYSKALPRARSRRIFLLRQVPRLICVLSVTRRMECEGRLFVAKNEGILIAGGIAVLILYLASRQNPYGPATIFGSPSGAIGAGNNFLGRLFGVGGAPIATRPVVVPPSSQAVPVNTRTAGVCPTCPRQTVLGCSCPYSSGGAILGCDPCAVICNVPALSSPCYSGGLPSGCCGGFCFGSAG